MILALVALGLVIRFEPRWAGIELQDAAGQCGIRPQRLSRLVSRAVTGFESLVQAWTRRGRPAADTRSDGLRVELERTTALLDVATALLATIGIDRGRLREQITGAYQRLHSSPGMSQKRFCEALSLPVRTLRSWLAKPRRRPAGPPVPGPAGPKPGRQLRRGRFDFSVLLPGTMKASDTTAITALGVELELVAVQDVGGRDVDLLDGVLVAPTETSEMVAKLMERTLEGHAGAQMLTDQGTPYMAKHTADTLDELGVEHAAQREGEPTGKATLERAFRSIKDAGHNLFALTNHLATMHPSLCDPELAAGLTHLIVDALLRACQHGGRMARAAIEQRGNIDPGRLEQMAERSRERARAIERSARLLLSEIHDLYDIGRDRKRFVDGLRHYPLEVLHEAEREFSKQVHRDDIRNRASYFAAIVRRCNEAYRQRQARQRHEAREQRERDEHDQAVEQQRRVHKAAPTVMIREALELIALQWDSATRQLLFGGVGPGSGMLCKAIDGMLVSHGSAATSDIVKGAFLDFDLAQDGSLERAAIEAIQRLVQSTMEECCRTGQQPSDTVARASMSSIQSRSRDRVHDSLNVI